MIKGLKQSYNKDMRHFETRGQARGSAMNWLIVWPNSPTESTYMIWLPLKWAKAYTIGSLK